MTELAWIVLTLIGFGSAGAGLFSAMIDLGGAHHFDVSEKDNGDTEEALILVAWRWVLVQGCLTACLFALLLMGILAQVDGLNRMWFIGLLFFVVIVLTFLSINIHIARRKLMREVTP